MIRFDKLGTVHTNAYINNINLKAFNCGLLIFYIITLFPIVAYSISPDQNIINQQNWISRNQENIIEAEDRNKKLEVIKKERQKIQEGLENQKKNESVRSRQNRVKQCFVVKKIKLIDLNLVPLRQQEKLSQPFLGRCFDGKFVVELVDTINFYYQAKGYITTRVIIPEQNIKDGELQVKIIEGKIEKIILDKDNFIDKMQAYTAFGNLNGHIFNLNDINQGLYQINRLPSNDAKIKIEPGDIQGESIITIANNKSFPARIGTNYDNLGNNFIGVKRNGISLSLDNAFFLNDNMNLNYITNLHDDKKLKNFESIISNISIPFGYNTLAFDYSKTNFLGTIQGNSGLIKYTGYLMRESFTIDPDFSPKPTPKKPRSSNPLTPILKNPKVDL